MLPLVTVLHHRLDRVQERLVDLKLINYKAVLDFLLQLERFFLEGGQVLQATLDVEGCLWGSLFLWLESLCFVRCFVGLLCRSLQYGEKGCLSELLVHVNLAR